MERNVLIALLGVLSLFVADWAMKGAVHSKKDVLVPDLIGQPLPQALEAVSRSNLALRQDGAEPNDQVPMNTVLRQLPAAGAQVREGKVVRVVLSQGGESSFVPEVAGQALRSAEIMLRTNFLSLGEIRSQPSLKYPKDTVISQEPAPRSVVSKNALVHLTVSDGPPQDGTILMPDFVGKPWTEAEAWAKDARMKLQRVDDPASVAEPGSVVQQEVAPDTVLSPGLSIRITISSGKGAGETPAGNRFRFEAPQGDSAKLYTFVLMDGKGSRELWKGKLEPGTKNDIPLPENLAPPARVRVFVDGILTEERQVR